MTATDGPRLAAGWITGQDAARVLGITPASFRKEASRAGLQAQYLGPLACYRKSDVARWRDTRPGRGSRTDRAR